MRDLVVHGPPVQLLLRHLLIELSSPLTLTRATRGGMYNLEEIPALQLLRGARAEEVNWKG